MYLWPSKPCLRQKLINKNLYSYYWTLKMPTTKCRGHFYNNSWCIWDLVITWVQFTMTFYIHANATTCFNGTSGSNFSLERSVRKRCFIVSYLYLLVEDALKYILDDIYYEITSLTFPDEIVTTNLMFIDDSTFYLVRFE